MPRESQFILRWMIQSMKGMENKSLRAESKEENDKMEQERAKVRFAGFWIRVFADFIDSLILDVTSIVVEVLALILIFGFKTRFVHFFQTLGTFDFATFLGSFDPSFLQWSLVICRGVLSFVYFSMLTYQYQTTLGKKYFGIYVVSDHSSTGELSFWQSVARYFSYGLSYLVAGLGFLMVGFHPEKRALHDLISGTRSVLRDKNLKE